ncbi:8309_t:CDS:10 [Acaulospora morrowiae]|uniref:8309_t:CDS:1 n=1 Tax=Acaulospora morrowiae TaxID=94023 RepID=A0A9N9CAC6_9GLOM|nr:8309_t:CDS:10 [Acaulospora morrowiae]
MLSELALTSSSTDTSIQVWDFRTGTLLISFKQNACYERGLALIPHPGQPNRVGLVISAQTDKALLHVYSWQKDQTYLKIICPEKLISLAVSNRGGYCAGGTDGGKIYVWELSTGILCRVYDGHYKKITVIKFTNDDTAFISGSEDAGLNVWLMASVLDESADGVPSPYYSWSDHSLPITDIICGIGNFLSARVLTSSLDHTCKLWDLSTGFLLTTFVFPTAITAIALDPAERMLFAGGRNNLIYQVNLYRKLENKGFGIEIASVGGGGAIEDVTSEHSGNEGSQDGNVRVWDINSRQMMKSFNHHKGPVTNLFTFLRPPDLFKSGLSPNKISVQPIIPFKRIQQNLMQNDSDSEEPMVLILNDNTKDVLDVARSERDYKSQEFRDLLTARENQRKFRIGDETLALQTQVSELQSELLRVRGHYHRVKNLHDEMYQELVSDFMSKRREGS